MAAIDKIYVHSYEEMTQFRDWLKEQPKLKDKYGREVSLLSFFFHSWDKPEYWKEENSCHPIFSAPCYVDAYIIRNCPLDYIQRELMLSYGHKTQEDINEMYQIVLNRTEEEQKLIDESNGKYPGKPIKYWWLSASDFVINEDGIVTMPNLEKSDYQKILDEELYISPSIADKYVRGKHFKIVKLPYYQRKYNYPIRGNWFVDVILPDYVTDGYMWHNTSKKSKIGTWDFTSEFVISEDGWCSSTTYCKSLRSIRRRIKKWKLPVGTIVKLSGQYVGESYELLIKQ